MAALEGAGVGLGGMLTVLPDISLLAIIAMRMLQKLSLIYGFEYATDEDVVHLWIAAGTAAGLDLGRDIVEKEVVERFVPRIMERVAARMGAEVAEKWAGRLIPVLSGAIGGTLNYYFIRSWGRRAQAHFRERHLMQRQLDLTEASFRELRSRARRCCRRSAGVPAGILIVANFETQPEQGKGETTLIGRHDLGLAYFHFCSAGDAGATAA